MEATFLAKRTLSSITKFLPHQGPPGIQSARKVTRACLSSAYERAEGSNAVAEAEGSSKISDDAPRDSMYEKNPSFVTGEGRPPGSATSFAADTAKDGIKKAVDAAENVGDTAKRTMDGVWRAPKDGAQGIKDTVQDDDFDNDELENEEDVAVNEIRKVDQLVDTQEYRSIEELKKQEA